MVASQGIGAVCRLQALLLEYSVTVEESKKMGGLHFLSLLCLQAVEKCEYFICLCLLMAHLGTFFRFMLCTFHYVVECAAVKYCKQVCSFSWCTGAEFHSASCLPSVLLAAFLIYLYIL